MNTKNLPTTLLLSIVTMAMLLSVPNPKLQAQVSWYNSDWAFRKKITTDRASVPSTQSNFPVMILIPNDNDLQTNAQADGDDIIFVAADDSTKLDHEIEHYDTLTGMLVAWVRIPVLNGVADASDTEIYLYYGNGSIGNQENITGVWDSDFVMVQHMNEDPSSPAPQLLDSTANDNDGTSSGAMTAGDIVDGQIGKALDFDGSNDIIDCDRDASLNPATITMSAWCNATTLDNWGGIITNKKSAPFGLNLQIGNVQRIASLVADGTNYTYVKTPWAPSIGTWYHVTITHNAGVNNLYVNGNLEATVNRNLVYSTPTTKTVIGSFYYNTGVSLPLHGIIDEVRISRIARSADWIETEWNNQDSPETFFTVGAQVQANFKSTNIKGG